MRGPKAGVGGDSRWWWMAKRNERGGVRILVLVGGGGGVFTSEYGTISHVICENREKRRDLNLII